MRSILAPSGDAISTYCVVGTSLGEHSKTRNSQGASDRSKLDTKVERAPSQLAFFRLPAELPRIEACLPFLLSVIIGSGAIWTDIRIFIGPKPKNSRPGACFLQVDQFLDSQCLSLVNVLI